MKLRFLTIAVLAASAAGAQDLGEVAFRQALKDLANDFRLLCVAAHPDDEDGATLAYYRMKHGTETHTLVGTRGEGGQNEIGPELYAELGVIRTHEMRAASEIVGSTLHFLDMPEFGYSKTAEETFEKWGKEETLRRVVRKFREIRPHVIITHHGRAKDHGHHQALGQAVIEAFDLAAKPDAFPEQLKQGLEVWQPLRLFIRDFSGRSETAVSVHISELEPWHGKTYAEIAAEALRAHASQGMDYFIDRLLTGGATAHYDLVKGTPLPKEPEGIGSSFGRLFEGLPPPKAFREWTRCPPGRDALIPDLWNALPESMAAVAAACEVRLEANAVDPIVTPGQSIVVHMACTDYDAVDVTPFLANAFDLERLDGTSLWAASNGGPRVVHEETTIGGTSRRTCVLQWLPPGNLAFTMPAASHLYDPTFLQPQLQAAAKGGSGDKTLVLRAPIYVDVAPAVQVAFLRAPYLIRRGEQQELAITMQLTNRLAGANQAAIPLTAPEGWTLPESSIEMNFAAEDEQRIVRVLLTPPADVEPGTYRLSAQQPAPAPAVEARVHVVDVDVPSEANAGIVQSYDTTLPDTLRRLGVSFDALEVDDYYAERLDGFSTIFVDIRAYKDRPDLVTSNQALLDYVYRGGTLIVFYQKTFEWRPEFAPYPIHLSRNRVTREDAPVTLLDAAHPLFTTPNQIRPTDWDGWVQERGLYFPGQWDDAYTPLIACNDPGEEIPPGSCLVAKYGAGTYCYTALVWYRQLRELHPGTLRVFANMLAL